MITMGNIRNTILLATLLSSACSTTDTVPDLNRLEAGREVAYEYCNVMRRCGLLDDVQKCARHTVHHLCEITVDCDFIMSDYRLNNLSLCLSDIPFQTCSQIDSGDLPDSCEDASFLDVVHYPSEYR